VNTMRELPRMVADEPIGKEVQVKILRKGKEQTVTVKLGRLEDASAAADNSNPPADNNPAPAPIHGAPTPKSFHPPSTRAMQLGVFKQWTAFKSMEDERCFVGSNPAASPRTFDGRGDAYLAIAIYPSRKGTNEVSAFLGDIFAETSEVTAEVAGRKF